MTKNYLNNYNKVNFTKIKEFLMVLVDLDLIMNYFLLFVIE